MEIGIDLGGTKIAGALVHNGKILREARRPTEAAKGRAHVLKQLKTVIDELSVGRTIAGIGIGVPGVAQGTKILYLTNIPALNGVDLKKALKLRTQVAIENDARCFALGEFTHGAGKGTDTMIGIIVGTGLGCGIIIEGKIHRGAHSIAGETSYIAYNTEATVNGKPMISWEHELAGPGVARRYKQNAGKDVRATDMWRLQNVAAKRTQKELANRFALFLSGLCLTIDPSMIVLGGGAATKELARAAEPLLKQRLAAQRIAPKIRLGMLGERAAMLGAAAALEQ